MTKTVGGASTSFLYDGFNAVQELSGVSPTANLLTGLGIDEIFSRTDAAGAKSFIVDALGSVVSLLDAAGSIQTRYSYEPFGKTVATGTSSTNSFQYAGRENDGIGFYYNRARHYSPVFQRFISEDPIEFSGGDVNLYAYTFNSPVDFRDPSGNIIPLILLNAMRRIAWGVGEDTLAGVRSGRSFEDAFNDALKSNFTNPWNYAPPGIETVGNICGFKKGQKQTAKKPLEKKGKLPRRPPTGIKEAQDNIEDIQQTYEDNSAGRQKTTMDKLIRDVTSGAKNPEDIDH